MNKDKTGVFTGAYAINPATGEPIPIWTADYVLMEYGTGAIMAVPGHDERDHEFALKFGLPIVRVVGADPHDTAPPMDAAFTDNVNGVLVNSGRFNGLTVPEAKLTIVKWLTEHGAARAVVNYRLHDWCISRQRYWGPPIPIIYCDACGPVPVPEQDLPVVLPPLENFRPTTRASRRWPGTRRGTVCRARSAARRRVARRTCRTPSSTARGTSCAIPAPIATTWPSTPRSPGTGCR